MKTIELYNKMLSFWPFKIDISDGKVIQPEGFFSSNLSRIWDIAENSASDDEWNEIAIWASYKLLHSKALSEFKKGNYIIFPNQIDLLEFRKILEEELRQQDDYHSMLLDFLKNNPSDND